MHAASNPVASEDPLVIDPANISVDSDGQAVAPSIWCTQQKAWWAAAFWAASRLVATWPSLVVVGRSSQAENRCAQAEACHLVLRAIYQDAPHLGELGAPRNRERLAQASRLDCSRLLSLLDQAWGPYEEDGGGGDHSPPLGDNAARLCGKYLPSHLQASVAISIKQHLSGAGCAVCPDLPAVHEASHITPWPFKAISDDTMSQAPDQPEDV